MYKITDGLAKLGLNKNQIALTNFILEKNKPVSASEIASATGLSLSRVYENLKFLIEYGIADKTLGIGITRYFIKNPLTAFKKFIQIKNEKFKSAQKELIDSLKEIATEDEPLEILNDTEEFYESVYEATKRAKYIKAVAKTPIFFIPEERKTFWRNQTFEAYKQFILNGGSFNYIINTVSTKGKLGGNMRMRNLKWLPKSHNFSARHINSDTLISLMITDKEVFIVARSKITRGLVIRQNSVRKFFESIFDEAFANAKDLPL